jgi:hypothetical protein
MFHRGISKGRSIIAEDGGFWENLNTETEALNGIIIRDELITALVSLNLNYLFHNHLECGGYP